MFRELSRESQQEFRNHDWGNQKSGRIIQLAVKNISVLSEMVKSLNINVVEVCNNTKHLLIQLRYSLDFSKKEQPNVAASQAQRSALQSNTQEVMSELQKIRKFSANQFISQLQQKQSKKQISVVPGSLNYHLKFQNKQIQTQLLECEVQTLINRVYNYEKECKIITDHNNSLLKELEEKKIQLLSLNKSLMNLLMEKAILQAHQKRLKDLKPDIVEKIVIDYSQIQKRVNTGYQSIIQKLVKYSSKNIFSQQNTYSKGTGMKTLKCMNCINVMILPKSKQNLDRLHQYYNSFNRSALDINQTANLIKSLATKQQKIYLLQRKISQMENVQREKSLLTLKERVTTNKSFYIVQEKQVQTDLILIESNPISKEGINKIINQSGIHRQSVKLTQSNRTNIKEEKGQSITKENNQEQKQENSRENYELGLSSLKSQMGNQEQKHRNNQKKSVVGSRKQLQNSKLRNSTSRTGRIRSKKHIERLDTTNQLAQSKINSNNSNHKKAVSSGPIEYSKLKYNQSSIKQTGEQKSKQVSIKQEIQDLENRTKKILNKNNEGVSAQYPGQSKKIRRGYQQHSIDQYKENQCIGNNGKLSQFGSITNNYEAQQIQRQKSGSYNLKRQDGYKIPPQSRNILTNSDAQSFNLQRNSNYQDRKSLNQSQSYYQQQYFKKSSFQKAEKSTNDMNIGTSDFYKPQNRKRFESLPVMKQFKGSSQKQNSTLPFLPQIVQNKHQHDKITNIQSRKIQQKIQKLKQEIQKAGKGRAKNSQAELQKMMKLLYSLHKCCGPDCKNLKRVQGNNFVPANKRLVLLPKYDLIYDE